MPEIYKQRQHFRQPFWNSWWLLNNKGTNVVKIGSHSIDWTWNIGFVTNIKTLWVAKADIWSKVLFMAAILNFKIYAPNEAANVVLVGLIEFFDTENMGLDPNIMSLWLSQTEIWSKVLIMAAILKSALCTKIYKDLGETPTFFLIPWVCTTIKSRVILYYRDGHELPPRAYSIR